MNSDSAVGVSGEFPVSPSREHERERLNPFCRHLLSLRGRKVLVKGQGEVAEAGVVTAVDLRGGHVVVRTDAGVLVTVLKAQSIQEMEPRELGQA